MTLLFEKNVNLSNVLFQTVCLDLYMYCHVKEERIHREKYSLATVCRDLFSNIYVTLRWISGSIKLVPMLQLRQGGSVFLLKKSMFLVFFFIIIIKNKANEIDVCLSRPNSKLEFHGSIRLLNIQSSMCKIGFICNYEDDKFIKHILKQFFFLKKTERNYFGKLLSPLHMTLPLYLFH